MPPTRTAPIVTLPPPAPRDGTPPPDDRLALLSTVRLEVLARSLGPVQMRAALTRYAACLESDGDGLLRAVAGGRAPDIRRHAFLLEGAALEMGSRSLARLCTALKEDPASPAGRAALTRLPAVLGDTLRATRAALVRETEEA